MDSIVAAFQRAYSYSIVGGIALTITTCLIVAGAPLWIIGAASMWRRGQRRQSLDYALLGLLMEVVIAQPIVSQLGLYTPGVGHVFLALLGIGFALAAVTFWGHWRRRPHSEQLAWTVARIAIVIAFLAIGLAHAFIPATMPRAL
jgi:hypothetical protein